MAPVDLAAEALSLTSLKLTWKPIPYTADGGYYEVQVATTPAGPFTSAGRTTSKLDTSLTVTGLGVQTPYTFVVRSFTPAHGKQQNNLTSEPSGAVLIALELGNHRPQVRDDTATTLEDTPLTIDVLANDTDIDGDPLTVVDVTQPPLGGAAQVMNNRVQFTPAADFNGMARFTYSASDGQGVIHQNRAVIQVQVTPANDAPRSLSLSTTSVAENQPPGAVVGTLSAVDPDPDDVLTFSLVNGAGDNAQFQIVQDSLLTAAPFDFEQKNSYAVSVHVQDREGASLDQNFMIQVQNGNDAPTTIVLSPTTVLENAPAGTVVGALTATDQDAGDTVAFALAPGAGSDGNAQFVVEGTTVKTAVVFDYEQQVASTIRVRATDSRNAVYEQPLTVQIGDVPQPPDLPTNTLSKCSGQSILLFDVPSLYSGLRNRVQIDSIRIGNLQPLSCRIQGLLSIQMLGNTLSNLSFEASVNEKNELYDAVIADFTLKVAGLSLDATQVAIEYSGGRPRFVVQKPKLSVPKSWGGATLPLPNAVILDSSGIRINGKFKLPTITTRSGYRFQLSGELAAVAGGYEIIADGEFTIPSIGSLNNTCGIRTHVVIFADAEGAVVLQIEEPPLQPATIDQAEGFRLREVAITMQCNPGLPIGTTGLFLTRISGTISLRSDAEYVRVEVTIVTGRSLPGIGPIIAADGWAQVDQQPIFKMDLGVALKLLSFKMLKASATVTARRFSTTVTFTAKVFEASISINAWSSDGNFHFTGSGKVKYGIEKGLIFHKCVDLPCGVKMCKKWKVKYPCGIKMCETCLNIPPSNFYVTTGVDVGEFTNGKWGFRGYVRVLGKEYGFFISEGGTLKFGSVEDYQLIQAPQVVAAAQAWLSATEQNLSVAPAAFAPYHFLAPAGALPSQVVIDMPLAKSPVLPTAGDVTAAETIIEKINLIQQADVGFVLKANKPMTFTIITPQGVEVTPANYAVQPDYRIFYTNTTGYELERGASAEVQLPRLRFLPGSPEPSLASVDVKLDGVPVFAGVNLNTTVTFDYVAIAEGPHRIDVLPAGSDQVLLTASVSATLATDYSVVTIGSTATGTPAALLVLADDNHMPASFAAAHVRVINAGSAPVNLVVDGVAHAQSVPFGTTSSYLLLAAGAHTIEFRHSQTNAVLALPDSVDFSEGGVYTLMASDVPLGGAPMSFVQYLDESYIRRYTTEYIVDQATLGDWKVKLDGDLLGSYYLISVSGPSSAPVLADLTVDPANLAAVQVGWRLSSDYKPVNLKVYLTPGPITKSLAFTDTDGLIKTEEIPLFEGALVGEFMLNDVAELGGAFVNRAIDLSGVESGDYYLWIRADDGVNPPVSGYAAAPGIVAAGARDAYGYNSVRVGLEGYDALRQLQGAAVIHIDQRSTFPTAWSPGIRTNINAAAGMVDVDWDLNPHPDVDTYLVTVGTTPLQPTQIITVGSPVQSAGGPADASALPIGSVRLNDIVPGQQFYVAVVAQDTETGRQVRSPEVIVAPAAGEYALAANASTYALAPGGSVTAEVSLAQIQPLYYPQVVLRLDASALPRGVTAQWEGAADGDASVRPGAEKAVIRFTATALARRGEYKVLVLGRSGALEHNVTLTLLVGEPSLLFLPTIFNDTIPGPWASNGADSPLLPESAP